MAGLAHGGLQNSFADLFQNASMILVPTIASDNDDLDVCRQEAEDLLLERGSSLPSVHNPLHGFGAGGLPVQGEDQLLGSLVLFDDTFPAAHLGGSFLKGHISLDPLALLLPLSCPYVYQVLGHCILMSISNFSCLVSCLTPLIHQYIIRDKVLWTPAAVTR